MLYHQDRLVEGKVIGNMNYELFNNQIDDVLIKYSGLKRSYKDGKPIITGDIEIVDKNGKHWDSYSIEIHCSEQYPNRYPDLYETSNKIPKIGDWHIYEDSLTCCITIPPKEILRCRNGITLLEYIDEEVVPYFFNQTHRRVEGYYANGEYLHGVMGLYQYYAELFQISDIHRLVRMMIWVGENSKPNRTSMCFCGSGLKYRNCHRGAYETMALIGQDTFLGHTLILINKFNLKPNNGI